MSVHLDAASGGHRRRLGSESWLKAEYMTMLLTERERRVEVAEALRELLAVVNSQRPLDEVLDYVLERAIDLLASDAGLVYMTGPESNDGFLRIGAARGL